jgi:hypothetical protein
VGDDGVLDAGVHIGGKNALLFEVGLGAIGAKADDAVGPDAGDAWERKKFVGGAVIDVNEAGCGGTRGSGSLGRALRGLGWRLGREQRQAEDHDSEDLFQGYYAHVSIVV